ncbi:hypothetical protein FFK22_004405 [Mycobacterium sp. KBS0706]|uniref:hypothetical protein n=1 Tax=Mycobacterium sp. KBS0706 TaxID=2578109 RepID=UPI00110FD211|nr:hypothetical protein [Mycobacterium sp. KBS0706]TSD90051.1 hypothetical protein FFK22_004405 [Mycobacterium sp. KBS0706]
MDPLVILKRSRPGDRLEVINSNGDKDDIVVAQVDLEKQQIIPEQGNAIAFGDVGEVVNHSETRRRAG